MCIVYIVYVWTFFLFGLVFEITLARYNIADQKFWNQLIYRLEWFVAKKFIGKFEIWHMAFLLCLYVGRLLSNFSNISIFPLYLNHWLLSPCVTQESLLIGTFIRLPEVMQCDEHYLCWWWKWKIIIWLWYLESLGDMTIICKYNGSVMWIKQKWDRPYPRNKFHQKTLSKISFFFDILAPKRLNGDYFHWTTLRILLVITPHSPHYLFFPYHPPLQIRLRPNIFSEQ